MNLITLNCCEPPGFEALELSAETLCRHIFIGGSTGAGKTSGVVNPCMEQLIAHPSRMGLLILDGKGDSTPHKVSQMAARAGRTNDVVVLTENSDVSYALLGGFKGPSQLDDYTRRLLVASEDMGPQNQFWATARTGFMQSALALLLARGVPVTYEDALNFMWQWWFAPNPSGIEEHLALVKAIINNPRLSEMVRRRLKMALDDVSLWFGMDGRSRENHRASLSNAIRPLLTIQAQKLLDTTKPRRLVPSDALLGRILVASFNAARHPELGALVMTLIKSDFFQAVQDRGDVDPSRTRLVGLIADEYQLITEPEDSTFLALARSRGAFVLASSQTLLALDERLKRRSRRDAILSNFNTFFFFNSREIELNEMAHVIMGTGFRAPRQSTNSIPINFAPDKPARYPICEMGALTQLEAHQAFVRMADGTRSPGAVWLVPKFYPPAPTTAVPDEDDNLAEVARIELCSRNEEVRILREAGLFLRGMLRNQRRLWLTAPIVEAIGKHFVPTRPRADLLQELKAFNDFHGMDDLPNSWLAGLLAFLQQRPIFASAVKGFHLCDSLLLLNLNSGISVSERSSFLLHETLNTFLYPSLWRRARTSHLHQLWARCPELRSELAKLPQWQRVAPIEHTDDF